MSKGTRQRTLNHRKAHGAMPYACRSNEKGVDSSPPGPQNLFTIFREQSERDRAAETPDLTQDSEYPGLPQSVPARFARLLLLQVDPASRSALGAARTAARKGSPRGRPRPQ